MWGAVPERRHPVPLCPGPLRTTSLSQGHLGRRESLRGLASHAHGGNLEDRCPDSAEPSCVPWGGSRRKKVQPTLFRCTR